MDLGLFYTSRGIPHRLGVYEDSGGFPSYAIVFGDKDNEYISGDLYASIPKESQMREVKEETPRRWELKRGHNA